VNEESKICDIISSDTSVPLSLIWIKISRSRSYN
jgi:hypothetical protein